MVIRFFQSVFEASTFVGVHYVLGSWYKVEELGKSYLHELRTGRDAVFWIPARRNLQNLEQSTRPCWMAMGFYR